ncbi:nucleolar zinc-finger protein [Brettanomyces nanus]|uniref:Nucleolar zinc-finger protein n=1 Tax=Eeniella nana TaxID=13502 RepID=A0A875RYH1_EENNA|nr:nucleolar zinc-finger protein [Brettanomyces nanus]QPG73758.1 nucleolar zinc-finger protein [Brettanomyces nanus]
MSGNPTSEDSSTFFEPVGQAAEKVSEEVKNTGSSDVEGNPVQEVESLCMKCGKQGVTRLLLTSIPYFKETIIMSFECPHCGYKNNEIQAASQIQEKGTKYVVKIENKDDFNRQVIKSDSCTCKFVELDVEIPAKTGQFTTVEGSLSEMVSDLEMDQSRRKTEHPDVYKNIETFVNKVKSTLDCGPGTLPITLVTDDPTGNSWVEYRPGEAQHKWSCTHYIRTKEQDDQLGIAQATTAAAKIQESDATASDDQGVKTTGSFGDNPEDEIQVFTASCSSCGAPCETHMKMVNIPHFKDVILMSTVCAKCGYKSNDVKTGGEIPTKGKRITLKCTDPEDLARDILKSETCTLKIPELGLDVTPGTLGGRFTTVEGILSEVKDGLFSNAFTQTSDSMDDATKKKWKEFFDKMDLALAGKEQFTVMMEDPLASSYIQNVYAPDPDPNMTSEEYERSEQENEDLGIADMKV